MSDFAVGAIVFGVVVCFLAAAASAASSDIRAYFSERAQLRHAIKLAEENSKAELYKEMKREVKP